MSTKMFKEKEIGPAEKPAKEKETAKSEVKEKHEKEQKDQKEKHEKNEAKDKHEKEQKEHKEHKEQKEHKDKAEKEKHEKEKQEKEHKSEKHEKEKHEKEQKDHKEIAKEIGKEGGKEIETLPATSGMLPDAGGADPSLMGGDAAKTLEKQLEKIPEKQVEKIIEHKWFKFEKHEKFEKFEKNEKIEHKEWEKLRIEGKEIVEGPIGDPLGDPIMQRVSALEAAVVQLSHFIPENLRPDLTQGALKNEPDADAGDKPVAPAAKSEPPAGEPKKK